MRVPRVVKIGTVPQEFHRGVAWLFWIFGLMLVSNVIFAWSVRSSENPLVTKGMVFDAALGMTIVQVVDTILVLLAWWACRKEISVPAKLGTRRRFGWAIGVPVLAVLLAVNIGYHWLLLDIAGVKPETDRLLESGYYRWWLLGLLCLQPAVVEEFFFRRLTFDFFCNATSAGTAAFASAMMFAAAHTGGLLSLPYLALFGFCMAWLRWFTGSLFLPIALHFLHNLYIGINELATS